MKELIPNAYRPKNKAGWRKWLAQNHLSKESVWLIYNKANSGLRTISHSEAVDEALCFGWIDSKGLSIDDVSYRVFFTRRKPRSVWSKVNKEKVSKLIEDGRMTKAGLESIDIAKQNGSWTILDEVEALVIPADLQKEFDRHSTAKNYFESLSRSTKRNMLQWLVLAKRAETRQKRIDEIITCANENKKPKQF